MTTRRRPTTFTVVKDVVSFLAGLAIMAHQLLFTSRADFNLTAWVSALVLVGVPGASQLLPSIGRILSNLPGTGGGPSPGPPVEQSPPSSASSTTSPGPDP